MPPFEFGDQVVIKGEARHLFLFYFNKAGLSTDSMLTVHSIRPHPANDGSWKVILQELPTTQFDSKNFERA
jgi:hypothetical protein